MGSIMMYRMLNQHHVPANAHVAEHGGLPGSLEPPPSPDRAQDGLQSSVLSSDNLFTSYFDQTVSGAFASHDVIEPMSSNPSSIPDSVSRDIEMLNLPLNEFVSESNEDCSGYLPKLPDLPESDISDDDMQWTTEDQGCPHSGPCCLALADKILRSLHIPSTLCLSATGRPVMACKPGQTGPRTAGAVFIANSDAMLALSRMLRCSCSLKPQLQLVIATSCDKLISWYYAMAKSEQSFDFDPSTAHLKPKRDGSHKRKERVLCQRVMIGDYCLDGTAEAQITARVVLAHLTRMEFLVNALSRRIKIAHAKCSSTRREREQQASSHLEDSGIFGLFSDSLAAYLLSRVKGAQKEAACLMGS